ncbi:MAG TPA: hypothetical protein DCS05_05170 [Nitrospiraceae bacterium]|nr:hypothetical protein [Nitrospiraceae bacterium]
MKFMNAITRHPGYVYLILTWLNFGTLLSMLFCMYVAWNPIVNLFAIMEIILCWLCGFIFTLKDARAMNKLYSNPKGGSLK